MANKKKRCRNCKSYKITEDMININGAYFCNINGATTYAFKNKEKGKKIKHVAQKKSFQLSDLKIRKAAAKKACHDYIRERDKNELCICCGRPLGEKFDAGHFLESGNNPRIRYDADNIHAQNVHCNRYQGGNSDDYEGRLRGKIGNERVDTLLLSRGESKKYTTEDLLHIEKHFKQKLKEML